MKTLIQNLKCIKKLLFKGFCLMLITCISEVMHGQNPQIAPLNPEFVIYMNRLKQARSENTGWHSLGLRPSPVLPNFAKIPRKALKSTSFPLKYDLRIAGPGGTSLLTSVKDQGSCGACWTFATMGAIEGYAKKMGMGDYSLSENNLKECHGFVWNSCESGGTTGMSAAYLVRKAGPVSELNDPYNVNIVGCRDNLLAEFWVSDIRYLPNDPNIIKQALLDYGVLTTTMYMNEKDNYNSVNHTYYYLGTASTNHEVLLVGWDDTKETADGTGAWIIKNSWGDWWGENGFFYISYNDTKINDQVRSFQNIKNRVSNSTQFGYDQLGQTSNTGFGSNIGYGLVRFSAGNKNYTLKQLCTYVTSGPATVRFDVYNDFNGTTLSNLMGTTADKACDLPGYYTFDLATPIQVNANEDFYIKVYYNTVDFNSPIPIEYPISGYANPVIESGKCWISTKGKSWISIGSDQLNKYDLCIKAYGEYAPCTPINAPLIGTITQPTCALATGSVFLTGLPATGIWTLTRTPGEITNTGSGTSSTISGLAAGTYNYTVTNASGCTSTASENVIINAQPAIPTAPNATAASTILQTRFNSNWAGLTASTGYRLDVATNIGFTTFVPGYNDKDVSDVTTFSITGLNPNTTYYSRVRAYNLCGVSPNSGTVTTTTLPNPPAAPVANSVTNIVQTSFTANWNAAATAKGYRIDVATNTGFTDFVSGFKDKDVSNVTSFSIEGLNAHTKYYVLVRAYNTGGTSSSSVSLSVTTLTNLPAAPVGLTVSSCNNLVTLKWRKIADPYFIRYRIYSGLTNNSTTKIDSTSDAISDTTRIITGLTNGQTYYFNVTAVNYDGPESTFSNQSSAKVKTGVIPVIKTKWGDLLICYNLGDSITSYQWYNGSSLIPTATGQYYTTNKTVGTYKVETIDINGCKNTSNTALTSGTKSLVLYPNPASVSFSIKLKDAPGSNDSSEEMALVSIFNSAGIKVIEFQAKNVNDELLNAISVCHLINGTYVVQVLINQKDLYYSKIVVLK